MFFTQLTQVSYVFYSADSGDLFFTQLTQVSYVFYSADSGELCYLLS